MSGPWQGREAGIPEDRDFGGVLVGGRKVGPGSRVVLRPRGRTDAQDMFLAGKEATVRTIRRDIDGTWFLAVTVDGDPAAELLMAQERYRYFTTAEVEPLADGGTRVLVAGIGNVLLGDDGFGVEVVRRMSARDAAPGIQVRDFGVRGIHLAYELLDHRFDTTIIVDAVARGGPPGTLHVIEADAADRDMTSVDAHGLHPAAVLALVRRLGGDPGRVLVFGCEPARVEEGVGLSPPVAAMVDEAARQVHALAEEESRRTAATTGEGRAADVSRHPR